MTNINRILSRAYSAQCLVSNLNSLFGFTLEGTLDAKAENTMQENAFEWLVKNYQSAQNQIIAAVTLTDDIVEALEVLNYGGSDEREIDK